MATNVLYLRNDWTVRVRLKRFDPLTSTRVEAFGLSVTAVLTETPGGAPIHASLSVLMTEGGSGDYSAQFAASDQIAHLSTYIGQTIYERAYTADGTYDESRPLLVADQKVSA